MKKRIISLAMVVLLAVALIPAQAVSANYAISVTVNGDAVDFPDQAPVIIDGRTLVPVRGVFQALGFTVGWNRAAQQVTLTRSNYTVVLTIGSRTFTTNGANHTLDVPAQIINNRTMLPIRAVVESVGYDIDWDESTRTVVISYVSISPAQEIQRLERQRDERLADLDQNGMRPLWYFEDQFRNTDPAGNRVESNFGLRHELIDLYMRIRPQITHSYSPYYEPSRGLIYPENHLRWNVDTRNAIVAGKENDSIFSSRPYNTSMSLDILSSVEFAFGKNEPGRTAGGLRILSPLQSTIGIQIRYAQGPADEFAFVLLHEKYHAMGLCEGLTDLAAEEAMGIPSSVREIYGMQRLDSNLPTPGLGGFWYNSTPFRTLLRAMEADGRGNEFWAAAFHSNDRFARLWEDEIGHIISWEDFSLFRAISRERFWGDPALERAFQNQIGISIAQAEEKFLDTWRIIHHESEQGGQRTGQPNAQHVAQAQRDLNELTAQVTAFAKIQRLYPAIAVVDIEIRNHHVQFFNNQIKLLAAS
ncbi:MAG: copper amine oxidase N-terminal domain-containing protein [Oscillospiraceae bacterium]|nr:copper amine oxidase N-terminal domain-containing protein [Oscillospiraceae bacterium]